MADLSGPCRLALLACLVLDGLGHVLCAQDQPGPVAVEVASQDSDRRFRILLEHATAAEADGDHVAALTALRSAARIRAGDPALLTALRRVEALLGLVAPREPDLAVQQALAAQVAQAEARAAMQQAELEFQTGQHEAARRHLEQAQALLLKHPDGLAGDELAQITARLAKVQAAAETARQAMETDRRQRAQTEARTAAQDHKNRINSIYETRLQRILELRNRHHYELALAEARSLLRAFPGRESAEALYRELIELAHTQRRLDFDDRKRAIQEELDLRFGQDLLPVGHDGRAVFPDDWSERVRGRTAVESALAVPDWYDDLLNRLGKRVDPDFEEMELGKALDWLSAACNVPMVVSPAVRVGAQTVSLKARSMRADHCLDHLVRLGKTRWKLADEAVYIGDAVQEVSCSRIYDVSSLVFRPPQPSRSFQLGLAGNQADQAGSVNPFAGEQKPEDPAAGGVGVEDLVDLIKRAVSPRDWEDGGHRIVIRGTSLLITAPPRLHRLVRQFLRSQDLTHRELVQIEIMFLRISDTFLEEIGVDWRSDSGLLTPTSPGTDGFQRHTGQTSSVARLVNTLPGTATALATTAATGGLKLQYAFMGAVQLSAIFDAIMQRGQGRILNSTGVTTYNGAWAAAGKIDQLSYIADYEVSAVGTLDPQIRVLQVGQALEVRPMVHSDRSRIRLDCRPMLASASFNREILTTTRTLGLAIIVEDFPLELPAVTINGAASSVTIPDGGTVLVGGFDEAAEEHVASRVPLLGHIPFLGRIFGKRATASTRMKLYMTMRVKVIMYPEEEANL